ncbi:hypothetical protein L1987_87629 [Smallanthus sonchifolius]|nr:hypothetical protein L1987_87629 [Smallanthus sonchifolius]
MRSIQDSRFHIIVFSKNYASSSWCLDELVKIMACHKTKEQTAYPIFYDVEPTEVRKQSGAVGVAFAKHVRGSCCSVVPLNRIFFYCRILLQRIFFFVEGFPRVIVQENEDDVGRWRNALKEAADLAGMELKNTFNGHEAKFIQQIVQYISPKLHFINPRVDGKLVGMETRVKCILSSLETGSDDIQLIGIKGIGGGGKTTLARAVFDHVSIWFEGKSFVENVREVSKNSFYGLKELQKQVLKEVLNDKSIDVTSVYDGKDMIKKMMCSRKVLIVLDDVDDIEQLEALVGEPNWFKPGSRIIITTRDAQVLIAKGVNIIHDVNLLTNEEAICLFSRYAFKTEIPNQGYKELSKEVVNYAAGLPLTIKVLGSHLCGRSEREWVDAIERLKTIPLEKTFKRLEISYDGLENDQKEIFLDVVCILKGERKDKAIGILESCGFKAKIGLRVLEQKSLITISDDDNEELGMHDSIKEMGMEIVRRLHPEEPSKHSRLWIIKDIEDILVNELGTKATRSIQLSITNLCASTIMKGLTKMRELKFLYVGNTYSECSLDEVGQYLPDALRYLYWCRYPYLSLPKTFQANKLVNLEMFASNISELWEGGERKVLEKLRYLNLTCTKLRTFDFEMTPHLEVLNLEGCREFEELHLPIECLNLKFLNLSGSKVSNLNLGMTPQLKKLDLEGCNEFVELHLPIECPNLKFLNLSGSKVSNLNLRTTPELEEFDLEGCNEFVELHLPIECPDLRFLNLSGSKVSNLNLGMTPHLVELYLEGCHEFVELHLPVECPNLKFLNLSGSKNSTCPLNARTSNSSFLVVLSGSKVSNLNLGMTPHLVELNLEGCNEFVELHLPIECPNLKFLNLSGSKVSNLNLGMTPHVEKLVLSGSKVSNLNLGMTPHLVELYLEGCHEFVELHFPVECPNLKFLNLSGSKVSNLILGMTPHLVKLNLEGCNEFVELHLPIECPNLKFLNLSGSKVSNLNLRTTPELEEFDLEGCNEFVELHLPIECPDLRFLNLSGSKVSNLNLGMTPHLVELYLEGCHEFVELHLPVECPNLKFLNLSGSKVSNLILGMTPHLVKLNLEGCNEFVELHLPVECPNLKFLILSGSKVSNLNLGMTPHLVDLDLEGCNEFVELHLPIECLNLKFLNLSGSKVSNLNFGMTPHVEELNLEGCNEFVELHLPIECPNLNFLNLSGSKVSNLNLGMTPHLVELNLEGCNEFVELHLPIECPNLKFLNLSGSKVSNLNLGMTPHVEKLVLSGSKVSNLNLGMTPHLVELYLEGCHEFVELHFPVECPNLKFLNLSGSKVSNLILGMTPHLVKLNLEGCNEFVELHLPVECPNLKFLILSGSKVSNLNLGMTPHLVDLDLEGCNEFVELHLPIECPNLKFLNLSGSKVSNLNLGMTPHVEELNLEGCNEFVELHLPIECPNLNFLNLSGSKVSNFNLGMTPHLVELNLEGCNEFVELHLPIECPNLKFLNLSGSKVSNLNLGMNPYLEGLNFLGCFRVQEVQAPVGCLKNLCYLKFHSSIFEYFLVEKRHERIGHNFVATQELTAESLDTCPLHPNNNLPKFRIKCKKYDEPQGWWGNLKKLISFGHCACTNLEPFLASICGLQNLEKLTLEGNIPNVPKDLYQLKIEKLPEELGRLKCLKELDIEGAGISRLPQSVFQLKHLCIFGSSIVTGIKLSIFCSNNRFKFGPFFCLYVVHYMERM